MVLNITNAMYFLITLVYDIKIYDVTRKYIDDVLKHINSEK